MSKKNWIAGATKNKGALHRALGIASSKKIPASAIKRKLHAPGKLGQEARLAQTLARMRKRR